jgi:hypothetical protein
VPPKPDDFSTHYNIKEMMMARIIVILTIIALGIYAGATAVKAVNSVITQEQTRISVLDDSVLY